MMSIETEFAIDRLSIAEQVYRHIKKLILSGHLRGGEKVPEEKVALQFKVSRTPIREALRRLERYGLIYIKPRSYAVVVDLKPEEAAQIAVVRLAVEKLAAELLCESLGEEDRAALEEMAAECSRLIKRGNRGDAFEVDSRFHLELARRTGNPHLYEIAEKLDAKVQLLRLNQKTPLDELQGYISQHDRLLKLLTAKDKAGLAELLQRHIMHDLDFASKQA